nr:MAG TPA: hypothetical protein [Bacteriophage sp.]
MCFYYFPNLKNLIYVKKNNDRKNRLLFFLNFHVLNLACESRVYFSSP